jgi:hypothetical protein
MNDGDIPNLLGDPQIIESLNAELEKSDPSQRSRIIEKFFLAALSSIPWIGGVLSAAETYRTEEGAHRMNSLQTQWLREHQKKILLLGQLLQAIAQRFESIGHEIENAFKAKNTCRSFGKPFAFGIRLTPKRSESCLQMSLRMRQGRGPHRMTWFVSSWTGLNITARFTLR